MSGSSNTEAVERARSYYDSSDADNFYQKVWGGEDIHVGLYNTEDEPIVSASRRTVDKMLEKLHYLNSSSRVLDIGSGYGGASRHIAKTLKCQVVALNLSEKENERARVLNQAEGLGDQIDVVDGAFEALPFSDASFDAVWSQDAILHSSERAKVLSEAARVLKPGGRLVFTDPMQSENCPKEVLKPILDRIHLSSLGDPAFYTKAGQAAGLELESFEEMSQQLARHYLRVREELLGRREELIKDISEGYLERMAKGLMHWVEGGQAGHLTWGIFTFKKA